MAALKEKPLLEALPEPVYDHTFWQESVRLLAFGKPHDWSLRSFTEDSSLKSRTLLAPSMYLPAIVTEYELGNMLFAPSPKKFNAKICSEAEAMEARIEVRSQQYNNSVWLYRGADADGLVLSGGYVYVVSAAGCPMLILRDKMSDKVGVAHAGMRSTIDEGRLKGLNPREHESVVMALIAAMKRAGVEDTSQVEAIIAFPIDPATFTYPWDHPHFGTFNEKRTEELVRLWGKDAILNYADPAERMLGRVDLTAVLYAQLESEGVLRKNISIAGSPPDSQWFTTRQAGVNSDARNLIIVEHLIRSL